MSRTRHRQGSGTDECPVCDMGSAGGEDESDAHHAERDRRDVTAVDEKSTAQKRLTTMPCLRMA
jgi:hypothetical protein